MNHYFITGATGTIGSALIPLLLAERGTRITLLIRAQHSGDLAARLTGLLRFWRISPDDMAITERITVLRGDTSLSRFGLDDADYTRLCRNTTHIIHSAAIVKMNLPLEAARTSSVNSVRSILELASACQCYGQLSKVDIVSTVGVGGRTAGLIPERPMPEVTRFHNTYEAAKAEAERVVTGYWGKLPITLHRPSMVVGDSRTGKIIHFQVFYHLCEFLSGRRTLGFVPMAATAALDIIPVDYVAHVLHWASQRPETTGRVLHLCSGPQGAIAIPLLRDRVLDALGKQDPQLTRPRLVPTWIFRRALPALRLFVPEEMRRALRALPLFLDYLDEAQGFANSETRKLLDPAGIPLPAAGSYLENVLAYYLQGSSSP